MSKIEYIYFPLDGATTVLRKHPREVTPPGMTSINNAIPARSDTSITVRPNWMYTRDQVIGMSANVVLPSTSQLRDILNSASGIYGSDQVTFFTSYVPYGTNNGLIEILSDTHDTGSCNLVEGESTITGTSTEFLELAYRGALVRFKNNGSSYTGSPYLWTDSVAVPGEWYVTDLAGAEVPLLGLYIRKIGLQQFYLGTVGALTDGRAGVDDGDSLGFDTLYVNTPGSTEPPDRASGSSRYCTLQMVTNISGSNLMWTDSPTTPGEYYLTERDTTVPPFVPDDWVGGPDVPEYLRDTQNSYMRFWDRADRNLSTGDTHLGHPSAGTNDYLTYGTLGSLSNYEWAIGNQDTLGFNTIYVASPSDPDVSVAVAGDQLYDDTPSFSYRFFKGASLGVSYYKNITSGSGGSWTQSKVKHWSKIGNIWRWTYAYYLNAPKTDKPNRIITNGSATTGSAPYDVGIPDYLDRYSDTRDYYAYGDASVDNLGYNTIYVKLRQGWKPSSGLNIEISGYHRYICSNYSWTSSASGTNEYFLEQQDGTELAAAFDEPRSLLIGGPSSAPQGTVGSLADGEWGIGQGTGDSRNRNTIYIRSDSGDPDTLGTMIQAVYAFTLYASDYKWNQVGATNEWYITLLDGTDPSIDEPTYLTVNGYEYTKGTVASLAANEWDYGGSGSLGFDTLYVYATSTPDGAVGTGDLDETVPKTIYIRDAAADFSYFIVDKVTSDTELSVVGSPETTTSGASPTFYYNHNPFRSTYKLNIQGYSEGLIYCSPFTGPEVAPEDISGPFYAGLQQGDWKYEQHVIEDSYFDALENRTSESYSAPYKVNLQPTLAYNGLCYLRTFNSFQDYGDQEEPIYGFFAISYGLGGDTPWGDKARFYEPDTENFPTTVTINGTENRSVAWFGGVKAYGSVFVAACYTRAYADNPAGAGASGNPSPGFAYTPTGSLGLEWYTCLDVDYIRDHSGSTKLATDWTPMDVAWDSNSPGRVVTLYWRASDDRVTVRYTDDTGVNFQDTSISGQTYITDGDKETKIDFIQGQFVIVVKSGIYYGDGASFTKVAISGATQLKSIAYNGAGRFCAIESPTASVFTSTALASGWTETSLPKSVAAEETNWIIWDDLGERWVVNAETEVLWTESLEVDADTGYPPWSIEPIEQRTDTTPPSNMVSDSSGIYWGMNEIGGYENAPNDFPTMHLRRYSYFWWDVDKFVPISNDYRSTTFSVIQGYTLLIGASERDFEKIPSATTETVSEVPTIDGTAKDFTFTLSNTGERGIEPESVVITAVVTDGTNEETETVSDDGAGTLKGNVSATGTINYDTGACRLVFNDKTVKTGEDINAAYNYLMEGATLGWKYWPRRFRWSVPQTYNDFDGVGSGTADANGEGAFLDARTVNGRVVVFESNAISTIVPRGDVSDPWDYEPIKASVRNLSNPVVIDDACYFIASDGLLWQTDAINVKETGSAFDITSFDDFDEKQPVILDYSSALNSLLVYYFSDTATTYKLYMISLSTGAVTSADVPLISDSGKLSERPASICAVSDSSDQRIIASHHPLSSDTDQVTVSSLDLGGGLSGKDALASSGQDDYWHSTIETGELFVAPEGSKVSLRHVIARTYTAAENDNVNRPYLAIDVKSLEDSSWGAIGDSVGTATMTTTALTGSGTAWSTTIAAGDDATDTFTLPCQGSQARVYIDSTLQVEDTDYTVSGNDITLSAVLASGTVLYAYWENYPEVKVVVGDAFKSSEGFHIVTSITNSTTIVLDHYLSTGSETVTHYSTSQLPSGEGETKLGIKGLVEGVRIRLYIIPDYNADEDASGGYGYPSIVKITGIIIGHVPQGRKRLLATGS
jgi:hypothetical protein